MGIRSKNTPNKPIHTIQLNSSKKMQRQIANQVQSSMKLFRTAQMSERRSHQSIREIECLRQRPVKDFATWYSKGDAAGETKVFLQKIGCTNTSEISFSAQYPSSLPEEFKNMDVTSLREYLESLKAQSRVL